VGRLFIAEGANAWIEACNLFHAMQRTARVDGFRSYAGLIIGLLILVITIGVNVERGSAGYVQIPVGPPQETEPQSNYISYLPGELPLVVAVPHGGSLRPQSIPDRQDAVLVNDPNSQQLALELVDGIESISGARPHLVLNELHRIKLDPNRPQAQGAQGNRQAAEAWQQFHASIDGASEAVMDECGWGLYLEVHSHGVPGRWLELGYGLTGEDLNRSDEELAERRYAVRSNTRTLALFSQFSLSDLIRGPDSLGGLMEEAGYRVTPSPENPIPASGYFEGGYGVYRHGSRMGDGLDSIQIEAPYDLLEPERRTKFVEELARAVVDFARVHYGFDLSSNAPLPCSPYADVPLKDPLYDSVTVVHALGGLNPCTYSPRRFCPSQPVSRREAGVLLWKALNPGREVRPGASEFFIDLELDAAQALDELWLRGYLQSCGADPLSYCPQAPTTRLDLAMMALRLVNGAPYLPSRPSLSGRAGRWEDWWLAAAEAEELLAACDPYLGSDCTERPVSRAEWVTAIANALESIERR
jgi:hypothetical protein